MLEKAWTFKWESHSSHKWFQPLEGTIVIKQRVMLTDVPMHWLKIPKNEVITKKMIFFFYELITQFSIQ